MPELPDVEGFRRYVARYARGCRIGHVEVLDAELVRNRSPQALGRAVAGARFATARRHGKWLIVPAGDVELLLHFGMTGRLRWSAQHGDRDRHDRVVFACGKGELAYNNLRRFGGIWVARDAGERACVTGPLGPDAARLDQEAFLDLLAKRRGGVKAALMDQRLLAGIGNLLSDEILWRARIHPKTAVRDLRMARRRRLYQALAGSVRESCRHGRVPHGKRWLTHVRDDRDGRCPRCATRLRHATVAGRTACWCPRCQRAP